MSELQIGQCTPATRMKVIARDKSTVFETTFAPPKGKEMMLMLIGLVDKGTPTAEIDAEGMLNRMGLQRTSAGKDWHAELQKIGTRLGLPAGSDVLTDILPAIDLLLKHKQSHLEFSEKMEWARSLAKPKELGMHLADVAKARYDEAKNGG